MSRWHLPPPIEPPPELLAVTGGDSLLSRLLAQRGLTDPQAARAFLDPGSYSPSPPGELPDMKQAVARLNQAIDTGEAICVWGDFDVDGQTSTALLVSTLQALGATVSFYIPDRLTESHGIKLPALRRVLAEGVDLILTCDTGIDAHEAVAAAQAAGAAVLITDHHDLGDELPPARAVINPKRLPEDHPLRELPGVGVAFKLTQGLLASRSRSELAAPLLDLVALGIVADVAQQTGDTRYLLQCGLAQLNRTERVGLHALLEAANVKTAHLTEDHIGFWLGPRLNALGRLGDANLAVELLTTGDLSRARIIALQLEGLNERRKLMVRQLVTQALGQLEDTPSLAEYNAIVLAAEAWHPGVLGIAASRIAELYGKPAILLSYRAGGVARGSARSVPGCDIHQALRTQAHLLTGFGGHPMAAGLSLPAEQVSAFRQGLSAALAGCRSEAEAAVRIDGQVALDEVSMGLLDSIRRLAPFGAGNPPVSLGATGLVVVRETLFGKTQDHKRVTVADEAGTEREVIWWGGASEQTPQGKFDLAFSLSPDDFRGGGTVQLEWQAAREWAPVVAEASDIEIVDARTQVAAGQFSSSAQVLQALTSDYPASLIWAEGGAAREVKTVARHQLEPAESLVVWSAPPGEDVLRQAINRVRPRRVVLVGQGSALDQMGSFIKRLMGLVKFALSRREGEVDTVALAAALGHRLGTARLGIDWLVAQGKLSIYVEEETILVLRAAEAQPDQARLSTIELILSEALAETAAYRAFFKRASVASFKRLLKAD